MRLTGISHYSTRFMARDTIEETFIVCLSIIRLRQASQSQGAFIALPDIATIMIAHGCDIRIVQKILRHNDIRTTLRYAHVSDKTQRDAYEKFLTL